jgi:hypothetical protein
MRKPQAAHATMHAGSAPRAGLGVVLQGMLGNAAAYPAIPETLIRYIYVYLEKNGKTYYLENARPAPSGHGVACNTTAHPLVGDRDGRPTRTMRPAATATFPWVAKKSPLRVTARDSLILILI